MPKRQKILLGILAVLVAYYIFTTFIGGENQTPGVQQQAAETPPARTQPTAQQVTTASVPSGRVQQPAARQQASPVNVSLEWQNDPFFREKQKIISTDSTDLSERLAGYSFTGYFDSGNKKIVTINGNWYEINDYIGGMKIVDANQKFVVLEENGTTYKLYFSR